jgi:hypothetical protein
MANGTPAPPPPPKPSDTSTPGVAVLQGVRENIESMLISQSANWERFWRRIQSDNYTFGNMAADGVQFWQTWLTGVSQMVADPFRTMTGETVPTVAFVVDKQQKADKVVELMPRRRIDSPPKATDLKSTDAALEKLTIKCEYDGERGVLRIRLGGLAAYVAAPAAPGAQASAVVYRQQTPIAAVVVVASDN